MITGKLFANLRSILLIRYIIIKDILAKNLVETISLARIRFVRYGTDNHQEKGLQMLALPASMGAAQEHERASESLPKVQVAILEQATPGAQKRTIRSTG